MGTLGMTLNQILYFQKIANLENYHQAAEELYISQPSLGRSMASLENELGVTLFEKEGRGVTLTKAGGCFGVRGSDSHRLPHRGRENAGDFDGWGKDRYRLRVSAGRPLYPAPGQALLEQPENQKVVFNFWQNHTPAIAKR